MTRSILSLLILCIVSCKSQAPLIHHAAHNELKEKLEFLVQDNELPGMNFAFIAADGKLHAYTAGYSDKEAKIPLRADHTLFSGSIGKTYAVALLMKWVEAGKVDLMRPWISYFPDTEWLSRLPNVEDFTVEMLLQHTSGLPRYVMKPEIWQVLAANPDKIWTYKDRLSYVFDMEPVHAAGKGWAYSDTNYILIGMLIEKVGAKSYYEQVQTQILEKFKLNQTHPAVRRDIPNLATAYSQLPPSFAIPPKVVNEGTYVFNPQMEWTGGGMASSTADLARWAKIYFEAKAFSSGSLEKITRINPNGKDLPGGFSYGMGAFIYETELGKAYGHSGFMPGFNSLFIYYPEKKIAAALQINCDYAGRKTSLNTYMDSLVKILSDA